MLISCGAALFGLRLAVRSLGFQPVVELLPDRSQLRLMARVSIGAAAPVNALERQLLAAVPHRHTHRGPFLPGPLPAGLLAGLQNDALTEGASLAFVEAGLPYYRLAAIAAAAARRGDLDPRARAEIRRWTRSAQAAARDGVPAAALSASPPAEPGRAGCRSGTSTSAGTFPCCPPAARRGATGVLLTAGDRRADWLRAGQALQRLLLHAASMWVFASLYTQPLEDQVTRALIRDQLTLPGHPQMLLQLGRAATAASTPRRRPDERHPDASSRRDDLRLVAVGRRGCDEPPPRRTEGKRPDDVVRSPRRPR